MADVNINPTLKEMIHILISRIYNTLANCFEVEFGIKSLDNTLIIKEFISISKASLTTKKCVKCIVNFRNEIEHNTSYLSIDTNSKLELLLLCFMRISSLYRLNDFNRIASTFNFIFDHVGNSINYTKIRNSKLDDRIIDIMFRIKKVDIKYLKYAEVLLSNCFYSDVIKVNIKSSNFDFMTIEDVIVNINNSNYLHVRKNVCFKYEHGERYLIFVGCDNNLVFFDSSVDCFVNVTQMNVKDKVSIISVSKI